MKMKPAAWVDATRPAKFLVALRDQPPTSALASAASAVLR